MIQRLGMLAVAVFIAGTAITWPAHAQRSTILTASIGGWARDAATQQGIANAQIVIGEQILRTDARGIIPMTSIPVHEPTELMTVEVNASGYALWRYVGVELSTAHPVELHVELGLQPTIVEPEPGVTIAAIPYDGPPDFVNIGRTFSTTCVYPPTNVQRVDRVPFFDYVRNVLPNEWVPSWPAAALDAGAVAVTQYAWSVAFAQRKWTSRGYAFDVLDSTCDQVYKDRDSKKNYASTDAAVARMWGTVLLRSSVPTPFFTTFYRARDEQCGTNLDCMGQWGTYNRALLGESGLQILHYYYDRRGVFSELATAPVYRSIVLERSADIMVWPGRTQTLSVCLRNAGTAGWQQGTINLGIVDPGNPTNTSYASRFANDTWLSPTRPTTLNQPTIGLGQNAVLNFAVTAPPGLAPGSYQLAAQLVDENNTWLPIDTALSWTVTVTTERELTNQIWLPLVSGPASIDLCP